VLARIREGGVKKVTGKEKGGGEFEEGMTCDTRFLKPFAGHGGGKEK